MNDDTIDRPDGKGFEIIVNGRQYTVESDEVTFDQVVGSSISRWGRRGELISYTVLYYAGGGRPSEGGINEGEKAKVKDGTVFNVTRTDRS